jgi:hypothetical protein
MIRHLWLIPLLAWRAVGSPLTVQVNLPALSGTSAQFAFDFTDGGPPSNSAVLSAFSTNGALGSHSTTGSVVGALPSSVTLSDASFFSEYLQAITLGTTSTFLLTLTANAPTGVSSPDEFSFFVLNAAGTASLLTTSDPTGSNSLFTVDIDGSNNGAITVYTSTQGSVSVTPVVSSAPEPSTALLLAAGILSLLMFRRRRVWFASIAILASILPAAKAQYSFVKIVDYGTSRPDGQGSGFFSAEGIPVTDGTYAVWVEGNYVTGHFDSLWANVLGTSTYIKLADASTAAPGGTGNFMSFPCCASSGYVIAINQGTVLFPAVDGKYPTTPFDGLFTVPAVGGTVKLFANYTTPDPDGGGNFTNLGGSAGPGIPSSSIVGSHVAFDAYGPNQYGVYTATANGTGFAALAETPSPCHPEFVFPIKVFGGAATDGTNVAFYGGSVFDPSNGYNAIYLNNCAGEVMTSLIQLPGNPNANFHTRIIYSSLRMSNGVIAFVADDANSTNPYYRGIFTIGPGGLQKVVSSLDTLPGLGPLVGTSSFNGISFVNGSIAFRASDATKDALFIANGGTITRVIGYGDPLDGVHAAGASGSSVFDPAPNALAPNGTLAFFTALDSGKVFGSFAAIPACAPDVTSQLSVVRGGFRYNRANGLFTQVVTVTNTSGTAIAGPLSIILSNLTNATLTGATGLTSCEAPAGQPYVSLANTGLAPGVSSSTVLSFSDPANLGITYSAKVVAGAAER